MPGQRKRPQSKPHTSRCGIPLSSSDEKYWSHVSGNAALILVNEELPPSPDQRLMEVSGEFVDVYKDKDVVRKISVLLAKNEKFLHMARQDTRLRLRKLFLWNAISHRN